MLGGFQVMSGLAWERLRRYEDGVTAIEYAVIIAGVASMIILAVGLLGISLAGVVTEMANALGGALPPSREEKAAAAAEEAAKPAVETPPASDEPGLDAAVADLVEETPKAEPER